jgi:hypothetical protein
VPWWVPTTLRVSFWRPIASATHWVDYRLWSNRPELMHAQNVLWFVALLWLVASLYRRTLGSSAGIALLIFVLDFSHYFPVSWVANRNHIIAGVFSAATLIFHQRWRERRQWLAGALAALSLALALLSAEAGTTAVAYLVAYAITCESGGLRAKIASLVPAALITVGWRVLYVTNGYGSIRNGLYLDPIRTPGEFVVAVTERLPALLFAQFTGVDYLHLALAPYLKTDFAIVAGATLLLFLWLFLPVLRSQRSARFWGLATVLAIVPVCAVALPHPRLLLLPSVGGAALIGAFLRDVFERGSSVSSSGLRRWVSQAAACVLVFGHVLAVVPMWVTEAASAYAERDQRTMRSGTDIFSEGPFDGLEHVMLLNAPNPGGLLYLKSYAHYYNRPLPKEVRMLGEAFSAIDVERPAANTLVFRPEGGFQITPKTLFNWPQSSRVPHHHAVFYYQVMTTVFADNKFASRKGDRYDMPGVAIEVLDVTESGEPAAVKFEFEQPLDSNDYRWLQWDWQSESFSRFDLPAIGKTARIPGPF